MRNIESTFLKLRKFVSDTELISVDRGINLLACRATHLYSLALLAGYLINGSVPDFRSRQVSTTLHKQFFSMGQKSRTVEFMKCSQV